jgi:7-carboxy-7-deazaguanine synthase
MDVAKILDRVQEFPARHVVLTGGEPMIAAGIAELATELALSGKHLTIETAGTVPPSGIPCHLASISPKLSNSTPDTALAGQSWHSRHETTRWQPAVVREWITHFPFQLKFVVSNEADLSEIQHFISELNVSISPEDVLFMPEGRSPQEIQEKARWIVEICKAHGFRYAPRVHLDLFGNTRGT